MGLLLRPDAYLAESSDGAYLLTHEGPVVFTGRSVYRLIERLTPHLDGRHTLAELTADLGGERREAVTKLVGLLVARGVVREVAGPEGPPAPAEPTYLGYFHDEPDRVFAEYQEVRALVVGEGPVAAAVVTAAGRSGLRDVTALSGVDGLVPDDVDLLLHVTTELEHAESVERNHRGWLGQVVLRGDQAWLGIREPSGGALWGSVRRRLRARHEEAPGTAAPGGAAVAVVANRLVHSAFRAITGLDEVRSDHVVRIDLSTLADERHRVVPHPLAGPVAAGTPVVGGPQLAEETFSQQAVSCADDRLGLFGEPTEGDLAQIPLHVCRISVSDPVGLLAGAPVPVVTGAGLDFRTARHRAALRAFACYASLVVDRRRLDGGFVTGYALDTGEPVPVPATAAFPAGVAEAAGVAAGYSWDEAVENGLMAHCRELAATELSTAVRVEPPEGRYRSILDAIGLPVTLHDITGSLGVPTFLSHLDGRPAGCASRLDTADALTDTLEQTVLHYQAQVNDQPLYAPPAVPALPENPTADPVPATRPSATLPGAAAALAARGLRPVAVPLDHDPEATRIMPYSVRVVLLDSQ